MITETNSIFIALAENNGFKRCFPWKESGDSSPRWLFGGALLSENDVAAFLKEKLLFDSDLRKALEKLKKVSKKG